MQVSLTKSAIQGYAKALAGEGCDEAAHRLHQLLQIFRGFSSKSLDAFLKFLDEVPPVDRHQAAHSDSGGVAGILRSLRNLESILSATSTQRRVKDVSALRGRLQRYESARISDLLQAVQVQRRGRGSGGTMDPAALAKELKAALGDDERFVPLFDKLSKLNAANVARVADELMSSGSSKSRKKDLRRIRERHESLRTLSAKERATAGRSAA